MTSSHSSLYGRNFFGDEDDTRQEFLPSDIREHRASLHNGGPIEAPPPPHRYHIYVMHNKFKEENVGGALIGPTIT